MVFAALATPAADPRPPRGRPLLPGPPAPSSSGDIVGARHVAARARENALRTLGFAGSAVVVLGVVMFLLTNNAAFVETFLSWEQIRRSASDIIHAFWLNLWIALASEALILVVALSLALVRAAPGRAMAPLRFLAIAYIDVFRAIPLIILLYLVAFGIPIAEIPVLSDLPTPWLVVIALTVTTSAYVAEVFRSGIETVHWSQTAAAKSLGFSTTQTWFYVVVPQAFRRVLPPLLSYFIGLQKDTALVLVVGAIDAFGMAKIYAGNYFNLSSVTFVAIVFILATIPQTRFVDYLIATAGAQDGRPRALMALLEIDAVRKCYSDDEVLKGVSLSVDSHEVVCLIGASGSGKSTLLRCINGLETIEGGEIRFEGDVVSGPGVNFVELRRQIGLVFQSFNLFPHMSVMRNVTIAPIKIGGVSRAAAEERARILLRRVGLEEKANAYPDQLSGGQQQRVAIARAMAMEPKVLLLDEITSALDPELVNEVLRLVRDLAEQGMTMVIATHEMSFAREVANTVCFLHDGQILEMGPPAQIFEAPREKRTQTFLRGVLEAGTI